MKTKFKVFCFAVAFLIATAATFADAANKPTTLKYAPLHAIETRISGGNNRTSGGRRTKPETHRERESELATEPTELATELATLQEEVATDTNVGDKNVVNPQEVEWLAICIYCEAGADYISDTTRYMVGDVVLNRVEDSRFPDTILDVLTQKSQYGRFYWTGVVWPERASKEAESHAVDRARRIAEDLLSGNHSELYGNGYVYQAEFKQGKGIIVSDGIYFGR